MTDKEALDRLSGINMSIQQKQALIDVIKDINNDSSNIDKPVEEEGINITFIGKPNEDNTKLYIYLDNDDDTSVINCEVNKFGFISTQYPSGIVLWDKLNLTKDTIIKSINIIIENGPTIESLQLKLIENKEEESGDIIKDYKIYYNDVDVGKITFTDSHYYPTKFAFFGDILNVNTKDTLIFHGDTETLVYNTDVVNVTFEDNVITVNNYNIFYIAQRYNNFIYGSRDFGYFSSSVVDYSNDGIINIHFGTFVLNINRR